MASGSRAGAFIWNRLLDLPATMQNARRNIQDASGKVMSQGCSSFVRLGRASDIGTDVDVDVH